MSGITTYSIHCLNCGEEIKLGLGSDIRKYIWDGHHRFVRYRDPKQDAHLCYHCGIVVYESELKENASG